MKYTTPRHIISYVVMGLIILIVIAADIAAGLFAGTITRFLYGDGAGFGEGGEQALAESDALAEEIAEEGIVMLRNEDNTLPLDESVTALNVFGWGATDGGFVVSGSGSGEASDQKTTRLIGALEKGGFEVNQDIIDMMEAYQDGRSGSSLNSSESEFYRLYEPSAADYAPLMSDALAFSDTAIIVISRLGGEGRDLPTRQYKKDADTDETRTYLEISTEEEALIELVTAQGFENVILLLDTCNVMQLDFVETYDIDAVLSLGALGQSGTKAIPSILKGDVNPSGRTVDTWPYDLTSDPSFVNAGSQGVTGYSGADNNYIDYSEDIYVGYKYYETAAKEGYIDYDSTVQYPFGYGLSYTEFSYEVQSIEPEAGSTLEADDTITVEVLVTNKGERDGSVSLQMYYSAPYTPGGIEKASFNLAAFDKTTVPLKHGESELLTFTFDVYDMASYDAYDRNGNDFAGWEVESGDYTISLRTDAHTLAGCANDEISYYVEEVDDTGTGIMYENDPVTGNKVENRFTGDTAYAGVAIDGSDTGADITYLSRENFGATFPAAKKGSRSKGFTVASSWYDGEQEFDSVPTYNADNGLLLSENGEMNDELVMKLGSDYEADEWDELLDQLSQDDTMRLVVAGGYMTAGISSIGKVRCIDYDGPSGINNNNSSTVSAGWTAFPGETVIASTWNTNMAYMFGLAVGNEGAESGVSGWYAPAVNIHRSAFGGRNYEYYSEDPVLSGIMGAETTTGALTNGMYCYVKHLAVNETETDRGGLYTWLTEQALREIYLKPFEIVVKDGHANAMMSSFNNIGAIWAGGCKAMLTDILRDEWGFRGSIVTDYADGTSTGWMSIDQGIRAGNDLWLHGRWDGNGTPTGTNAGYYYGNINFNDATTAHYMRNSAKNVLYTYCNAYYLGNTLETDDSRFEANVGLREADDVFPAWIFAIVAIDIAGIGGVGVWLYFLVIRHVLADKKKAAGATTEVNNE